MFNLHQKAIEKACVNNPETIAQVMITTINSIRTHWYLVGGMNDDVNKLGLDSRYLNNAVKINSISAYDNTISAICSLRSFTIFQNPFFVVLYYIWVLFLHIQDPCRNFILFIFCQPCHSSPFYHVSVFYGITRASI